MGDPLVVALSHDKATTRGGVPYRRAKPPGTAGRGDYPMSSAVKHAQKWGKCAGWTMIGNRSVGGLRKEVKISRKATTRGSWGLPNKSKVEPKACYRM
jgi:hypothetical protein